ncbi:MAG: polyprenyl synthetase family protein [Bacteroidales bacterium]|nr:polyprenyl synthetase family protein [Bacteroidales bacterium]
MTRDAIISLLGSNWTAFEETVGRKLHSGIGMLDSVNESLWSNSGKKLRPMIALLTAGALGGINPDSIQYAAACEVLHNATLLHDDVADKSATRRGKPTLAALMGPGNAVLVGDYWLAKAVELILGTKHQNRTIPFFSRTLSDLAEGEMIQLEKAASADTTEQDYLRIVCCKTASLFETACKTAAISSDASANLEDAASRFGKATGIAFQIKDDIFDYGAAPQIGKPVGSDLREGKITLPLLGAFKNAPEQEARIREMVSGIAKDPDAVAEIHGFVLANGGLEYAAARLQDFVQEALDALGAFPESEYKSALEGLARYNAIRTV